MVILEHYLLMYSNDFILQFKKTGKWEKRDALWLEQQIGEDGEFKDPVCKNISERIVSLLTNNELLITTIHTYNP